MDIFELKKEQLKLAGKIQLWDRFGKVNKIGGVYCVPNEDKVVAAVIVLSFPELVVLEVKTAELGQALPFHPGFKAYREMPAIIEAFNQLEQEPDVLLVHGAGINHPRKFGIACHVGLALNIPVIGVEEKLMLGSVEQGKIMIKQEIRGFEVKTKEHANSVYAAPGHLVSLGSVLRVLSGTIKPPHKLPEPLHKARKEAKRKIKNV